MNAPANIEGLSELRRIDAAGAAIGQTVVALLTSAGLNVVISAQDERVGQMFFTDGGVGFSIRLIDGQSVPLHPDRVSGAVAALDRIDPLLVRIEGALGISLDATDMAEVADAVALDIDDGAMSITLFVHHDHIARDRWVAQAVALPPDDRTLPVFVGVAFAGPRLTISDAAQLSAGDLLLVPAQASATLTVPTSSGVIGSFDLLTGLFRCGDTGDAMSDDPAPAAADFLVPLTIYLPERAVSAASLGGLVAGTTLPLGPLTDGMPVELRIANQTFARGELVQMGDRFAVLIEERADAGTPPNMAEDE